MGHVPLRVYYFYKKNTLFYLKSDVFLSDLPKVSHPITLEKMLAANIPDSRRYKPENMLGNYMMEYSKSPIEKTLLLNFVQFLKPI